MLALIMSTSIDTDNVDYYSRRVSIFSLTVHPQQLQNLGFQKFIYPKDIITPLFDETFYVLIPRIIGIKLDKKKQAKEYLAHEAEEA
ncbi:hypothetical protein SAMN02910292_02860 [Lachnospiraceae bacterium XBB2008]|nr:hypothetical protein SAMN02910292_02860 [Lachnospiraceae bacterium XBB2008]